ncbi:alpha/beta-hydrolase [Byssothecium circinans]|uniref:Alpha/beta-hydrolase n=1 Tax=Byssothecium circinans TaxID=147558 RepID=A0A6A5TEW2_9PLEO|nr:alpha/beta-hydrolase [Byssothecium circinans]
MPLGPFALQWRAPSPNPPPPTDTLPDGISRFYIPTSSGPLELLTALPSSQTSSTTRPPLFFAHGGFGCASVWITYMQFFASKGYPCYAMSYRGHGKSWYPGFWRMYFTTRGTIAEDLAAGVRHVEEIETKRRSVEGSNVEEEGEGRTRVVLIAHSAGGALSQYALSRGLVKVQGFCMFAAVPGFGSFSCYSFWALKVPIHFPYRFFHSKYLMITTSQVKDAFFTASTPNSVVEDLERLLSPYESMLWPVQALFRFVTGPDVLSSITGWSVRRKSGEGRESQSRSSNVSQRMLVLAADKDVLCKPVVLEDAAKRYRDAFREMVKAKKVDGVSEDDLMRDDGAVGFKVVEGLAHHLQNHVEWERGAAALLGWVEKL